MQLILWRHAEAEDGFGKPDTDRELTKKGRKQADRMAAWLRDHIDKDWRILVSPAKRTLQTVEPLGFPFEEEPAVGLAATVKTMLGAADWPDGGEDVVVVGHQPTLGEVAAKILGTTEEVAIKKGAVWWFVSREDGAALRVVIGPEDVDD